jgi:hypothetical protein
MSHASTLDACRWSMVKIAFGLKCLQVVVASTKESTKIKRDTLATFLLICLPTVCLVDDREHNNNDYNNNQVRTDTWDFPDSKKGLGST